MKNKIVLLFLVLNTSTMITPVLAETTNMQSVTTKNITENQTIDNAQKTEINENVSPENHKIKYSWKNAREALSIAKDFNGINACLHLIVFVRTADIPSVPAIYL